MTRAWAVRLPHTHANHAATLRLWPGVEAATDSDAGEIWLRGRECSAHEDRQLRMLPGDRFDWLDDGFLRRPDARVPERRMPNLAWTPIRQVFVPASRPTALPGHLPPRVSVSLAPSVAARPADGLLVPLAEFAAFALAAAEIRLAPLEFAVAGDGRALVHGHPLPSLDGARFYFVDGLAVPCGFAWAPALDAAAIRQWIGLEAGDWAVLSPGENSLAVERIFAHGIVPVTRSAVRATVAANEGLAS